MGELPRIPRRPWPLVSDAVAAIELWHAVTVWEASAGSGELPSFAEVGGVELWQAVEALLGDATIRELAVIQYRLAAAVVAEALENCCGDVAVLRRDVRTRCAHPHLVRPTLGWIGAIARN